METKLNFFIFQAFLLRFALCNDTPDLIIKTPQGEIQGSWKTTINGRNIQAFTGIPYAKPPVGPLRFKNPEPFGIWDSTWNGTKEASVCPQLGAGVGRIELVVGDEDCLYLNVFTPDASQRNRYPVMVFIYGGGFTTGGSLTDIYGPDILLDRDIVLVTMNYRIGLLGFASTEDKELPGNLGLKDQVLALKWVKDNIGAYGGNPDSVTLFGESAGGACVHYHMLSPLSKGLFHRAIPMSGTADSPWAISAPGKISKNLWKYGEQLNCSASSSKELVKCLADVKPTIFIGTAFKFVKWEGMDPMIQFTPVFETEDENSFITAKSYMSHTSIPMMTGVTTDEGSMVVSIYHLSPAGIGNVLSRLESDFDRIAPVALYFDDKSENPTDVARQIKKYFFGDKKIDNTSIPQLIKMISDAMFYEGENSAIKRHDGTAYLYLFAYNGEHSTTQKFSTVNFRYGVSHFDDLQYIFPLKPFIKRENGFSEEDKKTSVQFLNYITNFAIYGNPTPEDNLVQWLPKSMNNNYLLINGSNTKMQENFLSERNDFWQSIQWLNKLPKEYMK